MKGNKNKRSTIKSLIAIAAVAFVVSVVIIVTVLVIVVGIGEKLVADQHPEFW